MIECAVKLQAGGQLLCPFERAVVVVVVVCANQLVRSFFLSFQSQKLIRVTLQADSLIDND